jgi:hypothetical protein
VLELTWSRINEEWYVGMGWKDVDRDEEGFVRAEVQVRCGGGRMEKGGWMEAKEKDRWMQHRDFPGGHPSQYYSGPKALNFRVLMGSGVVALV